MTFGSSMHSTCGVVSLVSKSNEPWAPPTSDYDLPVDEAQVPPEFLSRGILIEASTLESL